METTMPGWGYVGVIQGLYTDDGKEIGNHYDWGGAYAEVIWEIQRKLQFKV